jgi:hypothetical protein
MSQKTELSGSETHPELSNAYLGSLAVASAIVLVLVFWGSSLVGNPLARFHIRGPGELPWVYPWILAAGQTIGNGMTEFSGHALEQVDNAMHRGTLLSILFSGILTPTLTLLLMGKKLSAPMRGVYLVFLIVATTLAVTVVPTGYIAYRVRVHMRDAQAIQTNRDFIINDLSTIAWKLREYRILPKSLSGGQGSFEGYVLPAALAETEDARYVIGPSSSGTNAASVPTMVMIHATSKKFQACEVDVVVQEHGELRDWTYNGQFQ